MASRLDLAADLGATHTVDTTSPGVDLVAEIKRITEQTGGPSITIDASGALPLIKSAVEFTANCGKIVILGVPPVTASLDLNIVSFMQSGKFIVGSIEGDAIPSEVLFSDAIILDCFTDYIRPVHSSDDPMVSGWKVSA